MARVEDAGSLLKVPYVFCSVRAICLLCLEVFIMDFLDYFPGDLPFGKCFSGC